MNMPRLRTFEKGKCRRCGATIPDRFWNPRYCWVCRRIERTRAIVVIMGGVFSLVVYAATLSATAVLIFGVIYILIGRAIIKNQT